MTWLAIVNPVAGKRRDNEARVARALAKVGESATVHTTASAAEVGGLVQGGLDSGSNRFLAVGGDGTVNLVVNALMNGTQRSDVVLGILPAGTGCDLVRTFGISQALEDAAVHLAGEDHYTIDIGFVDGPWGRRFFANVASLGLSAAVVRTAHRFPGWLGASRYKLGVWPALAFFRKTPLRLQVDDRRLQEAGTMVVLANAQFFGGGMNVAPKASTVDGELDVQVFTGPKRNAVILQYRVTRGTHLTHRAVRRFSGAAVELSLDRPWGVEVDGEYLGSTDSVVAGVVPGALRLKI
jgi:YegS/Rv2252/BmrU family lipid kinase